MHIFPNLLIFLMILNLKFITQLKKAEITDPEVNVHSALVMEKNKSKVLYDYNSNAIIPPASTTKLLTALIALDLYNLDEV